jgi:RNA polymerase sigma-70 factor (ECF subfamily)
MTQAFTDDPGVRLMLAYQAGDEDAFDRIVVQYTSQVYALLTRFLGQKANREDLVQEVFLRVIRARARYQPAARFSTFLYRIVFNIAVNETQRGGAREAQSGGMEGDGAHGGDAHDGGDRMNALADERSASPSSALEERDVVLAVREAIARLPENQRMALILAKYEELPYLEIASVLGTSEKAVKSLVHRARETLREMLAPFLQEELA